MISLNLHHFALLAVGIVCLVVAGVHFASAQGWIGGAPHFGSPLVLFGCGGLGCVLTFFGLGGRP